MSKPLELTIYPHDSKHLNTNWLTMYVTPDGPMAAGRSGVLPAAKHLTDAELAAEAYLQIALGNEAMALLYKARWSGNSEGNGPRETRGPAIERARTLTRFATTPHYFEADQ